MEGCVSLIIYFIVSGCCLGLEASSQLDHLKFRAYKASQQFIQYAFGSYSYVDEYGQFCESWYPSYSLRLLSMYGSFIPTWPFETQSIQSLTTIPTVYILGPTQIGLNMEGCVSLVIYFIVTCCCLGPEAWFKFDHLKRRASKASQQFIQYIFWVPPR